MNRRNLTLKLLGITLELNNVRDQNAEVILGFWMVFGVIVLALLPLAVIASLNTLFPALNIAYGMAEYVSMAVLLWMATFSKSS